MWTRRLYRCYACDAVLLLPPAHVAELQERYAKDQRPGAGRGRSVALKGS